MSIREDKKEEQKAPSTPAAESAFMARTRTTGGIDYSRQEQISQDEMTDELFAAFKRGDEQTVFGITTGTSKHPTSRISAGAQVLAAQAQEMKFTKPSSRSSSKRRTFADGGMMAALMAQTNGNEDLAQLLLAKLQSNTLMTMDGTYGDDMAREMGAYGLSESIRQVQRAETVREEEIEEEHTAAVKESKSMWSAWFGEKDAKIDTIDIMPVAEPEKAPGMFSKFACKFSKATGLSKVFGMFADGDATPVAPQLLTLQAATTNFTQRLAMPAPRMF